MAHYFKVDSRRITLREYWNLTHSWTGVVAWIAARLGNPMPSGAGFMLPDSVGELEVPKESFPAEAMDTLQSITTHSLEIGFHSPRYHVLHSLDGKVRTSFIAMLHRTGQSSLRLIHTVALNSNPKIEQVLGALLSELKDGRFLVTTDQAPKFRTAPEIVLNTLVGAKATALIDSHLSKLADQSAENPPKPVLDFAELNGMWDRYERCCSGFQMRRGLYVPMTREEVMARQP